MDSQRQAIWKKTTDPRLPEAIRKLGDAEASTAYIRNVTMQFAETWEKKASDFNNHRVSRPNVGFRFNDDTLHFEAYDIEDPKGTLGWLDDVIFEKDGVIFDGMETKAEESMEEMNRHIDTLKRTAELLGVNPKVIVGQALKAMELDPRNTPAKSPTAGYSMYKAMEAGFASWLAGDSGQTSGNPTEDRPWLKR